MKILYSSHILVVLLLSYTMISCNQHEDRKTDIFSQMIGKEIIFPDSMSIQIQHISLNCDILTNPYTIITYIDSADCTSCKMKLSSWTKFLNELKHLGVDDIGFLMIMDSNDQDDVEYVLQKGNFLYPVGLDHKSQFHLLNSLPQEEEFHTMLLDYGHKIVAVGNPILNPKIKNIYKSLIIDDDPIENKNNGLCHDPAISVGVHLPGDTIQKTFHLFNYGSQTVSIQEIIPSCDCINVSVSNDIIRTNGHSQITINMIVDSITGSFTRYIDIYYFDKDAAERLMLSGYINNPNINKTTTK